jgi:hypothetical protein
MVTDFKSLMQLFLSLLGTFMSLLYAAAFVAFFWGLVQYILNTEDSKKREQANSWMVWSVVALFVMVALWGIVGLLTRTFGLTPSVIPQLGR